MACFYKCPKNNYVYLAHTVLQRSELNEHIRKFLFCSNECLHKFQDEFTTVDKDGCEYYNKVEDDPYDRCPVHMMEVVREHKKQCKAIKIFKQQQEQQYQNNTEEPPAKFVKE
jgi:hypothetical protein